MKYIVPVKKKDTKYYPHNVYMHDAHIQPKPPNIPAEIQTGKNLLNISNSLSSLLLSYPYINKSHFAIDEIEGIHYNIKLGLTCINMRFLFSINHRQLMSMQLDHNCSFFKQ